MNWQALLQGSARDPQDPATQALAGVLAQALTQHGAGLLPLPGLTHSETRHLLSRWFPGALALLDTQAMQDRNEPRYDEIEDLVALLCAHTDAADDPLSVRCLAHAIALASLGNLHLWQDLGLASRQPLTALMARWFPGLARKNVQDMKWKKFLYRQLCEREQLLICKSPTCAECSDYDLCFGAEVALSHAGGKSSAVSALHS